MGEQRRWVISVDEETHLLAEQWQADFSPLVGSNRSSLVRLVFKTLNRLGFTAENIMAALAQPQQLRQAKAEQFVAEVNTLSHNEFPALTSELAGPKPPMRISAPQAGARRRELRGVSRRSYLGAGVRLEYKPLSFPAKVRLCRSNSSTYAGAA